MYIGYRWYVYKGPLARVVLSLSQIIDIDTPTLIRLIIDMQFQSGLKIPTEDQY